MRTKNFLAGVGAVVVAFFALAEAAKAADISFSGQIRSRWEVAEHLGNGAVHGGGTGTPRGFTNDPDDFIFSSVRLAADAKINDTASAFIQLQSTRNWGERSAGSTVATGAGDGNASATANNNDESVGVHQAYFALKNFANLPAELRIGRQELKLDGWRLFGNTIWTPGMQSHDGIAMVHARDNLTVLGVYVLGREDGRNTDLSDVNDQDGWLLWVNYRGVLGGQFSGYYALSNDECAGCFGNGVFHTVGGRQAGRLFGLDYRGEFYYQFGEANRVPGTTLEDTDRSAYMYGVRVGKTFKNVSLKPGVTLWYDYLSGTDDSDRRSHEWGSFNTLYDTGHKFYGLQDLFLGIGNGGTSGTNGLGLQDAAVKLKLSPLPGWTVKVDGHAFFTAESIKANTATAGAATDCGGNRCSDGNYLGSEIDVTVVNKHNANTNIMIGYSNFNGTTSFKALRGGVGNAIGGSPDANWAYVQFDVKF